MNKKKFNIGIIGAGNIANKYLETLKYINNFQVVAIVSRTKSKSKNLAQKYKIKNVYNSINEMIDYGSLDAILVLVSYQSIFEVTKQILSKKIPLLIEKPPGLSLKQSKELSKLSIKFKTKNMVALNRRFYSNFEKGLQIINKHGGIENIIIEGHERFWRVKKRLDEKSQKKWLYANSIHHLDLLRFFGGEISETTILKKNNIEKNGNQFLILLEFKNKSSGFYFSNWYSPGGWSVKLYGNGITVIFSPLEEGYYIKKNMKMKKILMKSIDKRFKPGFYKQLKVFLYYLQTNKLHPFAQKLNDVYKTVKLIDKLENKK